jgi:hypothetical protein
MKYPHLVAVLLAFLALPAAHAVALDDAVGIPNAPVRTEIRRGAHQGSACDLKAGSDSVVLADCIYKAHVQNLKEDTGTMPFMLGLFFEGWLHAAQSPHVRHKWSSERVARDFFFIANQHFQELGLDLPTVCEATQTNYEQVLPLWEEWKGRAAQPMRITVMRFPARSINAALLFVAKLKIMETTAMVLFIVPSRLDNHMG